MTFAKADGDRGAQEPLHVLALNSGSSSLKLGLYRATSADVATLLSETLTDPQPGQAIARIEQLLADSALPAPDAIGHRVVHGGPLLRQHCLIDDAVVQQLEAACAFAPLHGPPALALIREARQRFPGLPQVACFDTAFHAGMPEVAQVLALDRKLRGLGIQRYGFHGLSCESIVHQLAAQLPDRLVIAHLGNGASVTAVKAGNSIDTSMGLTPTGGVMMGTRSGDLDPGVLVYLMRELGFDAAKIEQLVDHHSGLLGVSGISSDMRQLHEAAPASADARLAIRMFCYSVRKQIAAMISVLDGIDLIVFTGGIGENQAVVRAEICAGLSSSGVSLDPERNRMASNPISDRASRCAVQVLASEEDQQIARHARALVARSS
jgi:acetate kinase